MPNLSGSKYLGYLHSATITLTLLLTFLLAGCGGGSSTATTEATVTTDTTAQAALGEKLFSDSNLSNPPGQSCASCHLPTAGFADPDNNQPTSEGSIGGRFGNRNSPTASYAAHIPDFRFEVGGPGGGRYVGGQFLDGRASTLEVQALAPFLNIVEMNMASEAAVIDQIKLASYAAEFETVFGSGALDDTATAYQQVSQAIAAFERTAVFAPFNSKRDNVQSGAAVFTVAEQNGQAVFNGKGDCARCHRTGNGNPEVFSNFEYRNIGTPANPNNPFLTLDASLNPDGASFVDLGLGAAVNEVAQNGKFRTPTLRNVNETGPYMHNGVFTTLTEVVNFYNRRDVDGIVPEVNQNIDNAGNIGNLNLTPGEVQDLVAFLQTLSDS
ncbi:MAG: cytochrome c peroxidase [Gammaproteobacteria bacterium]|jgi:cytochrome c peroxidase